MFNISLYLEKFKNFGRSERELKSTLILIIKEIVGVEIESKNVSIKNGEVVIKVSPTIKNAIYIKKEQLLKELEERIGKQVGNIR